MCRRFFEIVEQLRELGETATHLYATASTSGGTFAGLALGVKLARHRSTSSGS
ncbi:MAG: hypothetical protein U0232_15865 [Thermomicrobiales bacterium]